MKFHNLSLSLAFLFASVALFGNVMAEELTQSKYIAELKKSYDKRISPEGIGGPGTPVQVIATMFILDVDKVDDSNMEFNAQFYFRQSWNDSRLQYRNRKEDIILRNVDDIWTPDLFFVEERDGKLHQIIHPNTFCRIKPDGEVLYSVKLSITFGCPMDLRNYPHDTQICQINIESYGFQRKHIILNWSDKAFPPIGVADDIDLLEYDLTGVTSSASNITFTSGEYGRLEVRFTFKRKFGFFATRLYVPFVLLVVMSMLSFWVKAKEKCLRLVLLLVILYLMVTIASEMNSSTPPAPYTKASDVWIAFCESFVFAAFLEFLLVALISRRKHEDDDSKSKGEILLSLESETKDQSLNSDSIKSTLSKFTNMFYTRKGRDGRGNAKADRLDKVCRIVFPIIFLLFNIVYWSVYCCA